MRSHYTREEERWFFSFVELGGSCPALWIGGMSGYYGTCRFRGKSIRAHRLAFAMHRNLPLEDIVGGDVLHMCAGKYALDDFTDKMRDGRTGNGQRNGAYTHPERVLRGSASGMSVLTEVEVLEIRHQFAANVPAQVIARRYGMDTSVILDAVRGTTWAHVGGPLAPSDRDLHPRGAQASWSKLTDADVRAIRFASRTGTQGKVLAARYNVHPSTISMIISRQRWQHI
jgi:hypothetical protein